MIKGDQFRHLWIHDELSDGVEESAERFGTYPYQRCVVLKATADMVFFMRVWTMGGQEVVNNVIEYYHRADEPITALRPLSSCSHT